MYLSLDSHGGGCCGILHLYDFSGSEVSVEKQLDKILASWIEEEYDEAFRECSCGFCPPPPDPKTFNALLEVVLTDSQMQMYGQLLKKRGFRLVTRFKNSNSGNYCNILHYTPCEPAPTKPPYTW